MEIKRSRCLMPPPLVFVDKMIVSHSTVKWILHASVIHVFEYACKELNTVCIHSLCLPPPPHPWAVSLDTSSQKGTVLLCEKTSMASQSSQVYTTCQWSQNRNLFCSFSWMHLSLGLQGPFQRKLKELSDFHQERQKTSKVCPHSQFGSSLSPLWICSCFPAVEDFSQVFSYHRWPLPNPGTHIRHIWMKMKALPTFHSIRGRALGCAEWKTCISYLQRFQTAAGR